MTNIILSDEVHKDCDSDDLENTRRSLVDENGICRICGHDHSFTGKEKILGIVHKSYTHPTLIESRRERRPGRPKLRHFIFIEFLQYCIAFRSIPESLPLAILFPFH